jgi:glycosyltransferase involved in cell wall biosynthesis
MDSTPMVSVIIPTYNRAHTIGRALRSVLNQTYRNLEVIVVDDGSTDGTRSVVESFDDGRVRYIRSESNLGATVSRNLGIKSAKADFIAFQDSDDEWLSEKLEKQMAVFAQADSNVGVVYSGFFRVENNKATYYPSNAVMKKSGNVLVSLLRGNFVTTQAAVVRRECFLTSGMFDEDLPRFQDWELVIRLAKRYAFICVDEPLLLAYYSPVSITASRHNLPVALRMVLRKHHDVYSQNPRIYCLHRFFLLFGRHHVHVIGFFSRYPTIKNLLKIFFK